MGRERGVLDKENKMCKNKQKGHNTVYLGYCFLFNDWSVNCGKYKKEMNLER